MKLQISKSEPEVVNAARSLYSNGYWTVKGPGVCALFLFDDPREAHPYYCNEEEAHRSAVTFMVAMQNAGNPAAMLGAVVEADFHKGCEQ